MGNWGEKNLLITSSGQIITTSAEVTLNGGLIKPWLEAYQVSGAVQAKPRRVVFAMGDLQLEDPVFLGQSYTCLAVLMVRGSGQIPHKLRTMVYGCNLEFHGTLDDNESTFLLVKTKITSIEGRIVLTQTDETSVIPRPPATVDGIRQVVELCAGIGCLGCGFKAADFRVVLRVDHNQKMNQFSHQLDNVPTVEADIGCDQTVVSISKAAPRASVMTSGVACQPYSKLGDKQMQHDHRAQTLPSSLRIGFLLRQNVILLECVDDAYQCEWVQKIVKQFVQQTHYHCCQGILRLQDVWPARRSRWWCLLVHPGIGPIQWYPFPMVQPKPMVVNMLESFIQCTPEELHFLQLDEYEVGKFALKGLDRNMVQRNGQMNTSLHSCGNQLSSCPCGCRKHPFSEQRLNEGGLHGLLIQVGIQHDPKSTPNIRHIHPDELALLNGMQPGLNCGQPSQYKMALCGLGQLASPLQAGWIASQIRGGLFAYNLWHSTPPTPNETLKYMMQQLLMSRDQVFGTQQHPSADFFNRMVWGNVDNFVLPNPFEKPSAPSENGFPIQMPTVAPQAGRFCQAEVPVTTETQPDCPDSLIVQPSSVRHFQTTKAFSKGAVAGFEVKRENEPNMSNPKRQKIVEVPAYQEPAAIVQVVEPIGIPSNLSHRDIAQQAADDQTHRSEEATGTIQTSSPRFEESQSVCIVHVAQQGSAIIPITIPVGSSASQIANAEEKLGTMTQPIAVTTAMGEYMRQLDDIQPDQFLVLHDGNETPKHFGVKCPKISCAKPPMLFNDKRDILLWQQFGWVATDEMNFYLTMIDDKPEGSFHQILQLPDEVCDPTLPAQFILNLASQMQKEGVPKVGSAILFRQHWEPVVVEKKEDHFVIHTTKSFAPEIRDWCHQAWQTTAKSLYLYKRCFYFYKRVFLSVIFWISGNSGSLRGALVV